MMPRIAGGWQTTMADLALILFIVSVAGLKAQTDERVEIEPSPRGEATAIYRAGPNAPPVGQWLAEQAPDARQQLTIVARYRPGGAEAAARRALDMAEQAGPSGRGARIMLEQGTVEEAVAILAFDRPEDDVARALHSVGQNHDL